MIIAWEGKVTATEVKEDPNAPRCDVCGAMRKCVAVEMVVKKRQGIGAARFKKLEQHVCSSCMSSMAHCKKCDAVGRSDSDAFIWVHSHERRPLCDAERVPICGCCAHGPGEEGRPTLVMFDQVCGCAFFSHKMVKRKGHISTEGLCDAPSGYPSSVTDGAEEFYLCSRCATRLKSCGKCGLWTASIHTMRCRSNPKDKHPTAVTMCGMCVRDAAPETLEYGYTPEMSFWHHEAEHPYLASNGTGSSLMKYPFMGVELEMDCGSSGKELTRWAKKELAGKFYLKRDGSLSSLGVEAVTHPATLERHMSGMGWKALLEKAKSCGYVSWNAEKSCGLHVHIGRWAFDPNQKTISKPGDNSVPALWWLSRFYGTNMEQIAILSGRENEHYAKLREFNTDEGGIDPEDIEICSGHGGDRYWAVNFSNKYTIELRHFRGSLREGTIMMSVAYAHALSKFCLKLAAELDKDDHPADSAMWHKFCQFINKESNTYEPYDLLISELKRRGLWLLTESANDTWSRKYIGRSLTDVVYEEMLNNPTVHKEEIDANVDNA